MTKSGEKLEKVGKSREKWGKVGKVGKSAFLNFWTKWPPAGILDWTTMSVIELVRDIWMNNACVKFEESYRANNEIVTRRTAAARRLRC